jgi:D-3-phosphoglycerate dehydrogenase / 2-oxoglutarate reductase
LPTVLITPPVLRDRAGAFLEILQQAGCDVRYPRQARLLSEVEIRDQIGGVDAVIASPEPYTRAVLAQADRLKIIARTGVGYEMVDLDAATRRGILVTITPGANHESVAEYAMALVLALGRGLPWFHASVSAGEWKRLIFAGIRGRTLGIVGLGRIGKAVAERAHAFGLRLIATEAFPDQAFVARLGIELVPLPRLLAEADFVTLHTPVTAETRGLINRGTLALMKPTAHLINTARGELVDEQALADALRERRLAGAGLDVFHHEPPAGSPLLGLENVLYSPHIAGIDSGSLEAMATMAAETVVAVLRGEAPLPERVANPDVLGSGKRD